VAQATDAATTSHPLAEIVIGHGLSKGVSALIGGPLGFIASTAAGSAGTALTQALYTEAAVVQLAFGHITPAAAAIAATTCHRAQVAITSIIGLEMVLGASGAYCAHGLITDGVKEKIGNTETTRAFVVDAAKLMTDERLDLLEAKQRGEANTAKFMIKGVQTEAAEANERVREMYDPERQRGSFTGFGGASKDKKQNISKGLSMLGYSAGTINRVIDLQESKQNGAGRLTRRNK
jgi:hypothetical protein